MKRLFFALVIMSYLWSFGCAYQRAAVSPSAFAQSSSRQEGRMLIWTASLDIESNNVADTLQRARAIARKFDGFAQEESSNGDRSAKATLRVPSDRLQQFVSELRTIGRVTNERISSDDVTEQFIDVQAKLDNAIVLRDRLRALLDKANTVETILRVETELARVQSEIDSMEGRIKSLSSRSEMATVHLRFNRKKIYGPLGYLIKETSWLIGKLFVIQE